MALDLLLQHAALIGERLTAAKATVAVAESSSAGLVSAALLAVPGASAYFLGGAVVYTQRARLSLLAIEAEAMASMRPSSEPYAALLADTVRERFGATWGIAETGAAGPSGNRYGDPPGHSCIAVSGTVRRVLTIETASADRVANMHAFASSLLQLFAEALERRP